LIALSLGVLVSLAVKIEKLMAQKGQAEIYKVERMEGACTIAFGLGTRHGVKPGDQVTILNPEGSFLGIALIQQSSAQDSVALATLDQSIKPGYLVSCN
jgi:hypothetical protein